MTDSYDGPHCVAGIDYEDEPTGFRTPRQEASALVLEDEARQLETVARLVRGDMSAMTAWLPSWRWTAEMCEEIR